MPWVKGQSGNPRGRPRTRTTLAAARSRSSASRARSASNSRLSTVNRFASAADKYRGAGRPINIFRNTATVQEGYLPFNQQGYFRLPFSENFAITTNGTSGLAGGTYTYNLSGPYDPRIQLLGGQPMQWDQINPLYERYWVRKAEVSVHYSNPSGSGMIVGCRVRASTNPIEAYGKTIDQCREMDLTKMRTLNMNGEGNQTFKFTVYPWQIIGITKDQYNNLEYGAAINTIPQVSTVLEPFAFSTVAAADLTIRCYVKIIYYIQLTNKQTVFDA